MNAELSFNPIVMIDANNEIMKRIPYLCALRLSPFDAVVLRTDQDVIELIDESVLLLLILAN